MKIAPDSSHFSPLSRLPSPGEVRRRVRPGGAGEQQAVDPAKREKDARDAIVRQALREAAQRQAALRKGAPDVKAASNAQSAAATGAVSAAGEAHQARSAGVVSREAPFAETQPKFVRLGQFVDIRV